MREREKHYLNEYLPGWQWQVMRYRSNQADSIHAWLRDCVTETLIDDARGGQIGPNNSWVSSAGLTTMVRELVNEAAAQGIDVITLMKQNTPIEFGYRARSDPRLQEHLDRASQIWVDRESSRQKRLAQLTLR
jgi:hypothetical protein